MDIYLILIIVLQILGVLICIKSHQIQKAACKIDAKICEDKDMPWEEFDRIRREKVWEPKRKSDYLTILGIILMNLPNGIYGISHGLNVIATMGVIATILFTLLVLKNHW